MNTTMNSSEHPDLEVLSGFLVQPESEQYTRLRAHLIQCGHCRQEISKLSAIKDSMIHFTSQATQAVEQDPRIAQYVDGQLNPEDHNELNQLLQQQPAALKAALHYATHSAAMKRELADNAPHAKKSETTAPSTDTKTANPLLGQLKHILTLRSPVWANAMAATMIIAVALLFIPTADKHLRNEQIATYQDSDLIYFQDKTQPGIGFFGKAHSSSKPFKAMQVSIMNSAVTLQWPPVENANQYTIQLRLVRDEQKILVEEKSTNVNQIRLEGHQPQFGKRYEWTLTGYTQDSKTFYTNGGFVINQPSK